MKLMTRNKILNHCSKSSTEEQKRWFFDADFCCFSVFFLLEGIVIEKSKMKWFHVICHDIPRWSEPKIKRNGPVVVKLRNKMWNDLVCRAALIPRGICALAKPSPSSRSVLLGGNPSPWAPTRSFGSFPRQGGAVNTHWRLLTLSKTIVSQQALQSDERDYLSLVVDYSNWTVYPWRDGRPNQSIDQNWIGT